MIETLLLKATLVVRGKIESELPCDSLLHFFGKFATVCLPIRGYIFTVIPKTDVS